MRLALLITLACALTVCFATANDPLIGRWRALELGPNGTGQIFEFHSGKDVDAGPATILDGSFRLVGTDIVLKSSKDAPETKLDLEWDGRDQIRIENEPANQVIKLIRVGALKDTGNPLFGEWMTPDGAKEKKLPSLSLFYQDGRNLWVIPQSTQHGHYSVDGKTIRIELPNRPVIEGLFSVEGNHLKLPNLKGSESNFERY
jgi:hypothetical protein